MRYKTGIPLLDDILGGGIPVGLCEIYGADGVGKTCLALSVMRECSDPVAFINMEHRADPSFINKMCGNNILYVVPKNGEVAIETCFSMLQHGAKIVCIDTTDALIPMAEQHMLIGHRVPLAQKRLVFHGGSKIAEIAKKKKALVILTSQIRVNPLERNPKERSSFHKVTDKIASSIIRLEKVSSVSEYGTKKYTKVKTTVEKLRNHPPSGTEHIYLWAGTGFDQFFELFRKLERSIFTRHGNYWKVNDMSIGPGYDNAVLAIRNNYELFHNLLGEKTWEKQ